MTAPRIVTSLIEAGGFVIWQAWLADLGPHSSPIGDGPTEADAIDDLMWMLAEMEAAR
jgi:hypothetical protein